MNVNERRCNTDISKGKILYLVRHAEASWMNSGQRDFDRPLNDCGKRDAVEMGRRLKADGILPGAILSSPALRATQTAEIIATELGFPVDSIFFAENIYEATTANLIGIVQSLEDRHSSTMLIGHNPAMTWLINHLADGHIANAPTCAIATLRTFSTRWEDAGSATANLLDFDYPGKPLGSNIRPVSRGNLD